MATYDLTSTTPTRIHKQDVINVPYSGSAKSITLPEGEYQLEVWGAQGGYRTDSTKGGLGGYSKGTLTLTESTVIYLYAGGSGGTSNSNTGAPVTGGFNGGGYRYGYPGGGGGSDIRIGQDSYYARVIVAGGGGSDGATSKTGMYGGGEAGGSASESYGSYGEGGTQTGIGSGTAPSSQYTTNSSSCYPGGFGFGGFGIYRSSGFGGAGGGGWYGGNGAYPDKSGDDDRGGGGGSGYVYTSSTAANYPSGCLLNSSYYLTNTSLIAGNASFTSPTGTNETGHSGDGYCRITVIKVKSASTIVKVNSYYKLSDAVFVKVNNAWKEAEQAWIKINNVWKEWDSVETVTLKNLVGERGSFEDSSNNTSYWTSSTDDRVYDSYSKKHTSSTAATEQVFYLGTVDQVKDHKYFVSLYMKQSNLSETLDIYWPEAEPVMISAWKNSSVNTWQRHSAIVTRSNWESAAQQMRIDNNNCQANATMYIDGLMLVDLTEAFGAGNEPSLDWCNSNITFTTSSITVPKNF